MEKFFFNRNLLSNYTTQARSFSRFSTDERIYIFNSILGRFSIDKTQGKKEVLKNEKNEKERKIAFWERGKKAKKIS
ncbi:MAG: hypothetical protein PHE47_08890 [Oscillospiraceae bacterium]|nr:hypothetical protein [Oscillospiraceae bacterium]